MLVVLLGLARVAGFAAPAVEYYVHVPVPLAPAGPSPYESVVNLRPLSFTLTANWTKVRLMTTEEEFTSNPLFWRNMHFDDWDRLPEETRNVALARMLDAHRDIALNRSAWQRMSAEEWDLVPQPLRAVIYPGMIAAWADAYGLTAIYGLERAHVLNTLNAVMMAESWFEHRGVNVNAWGNRDLGLGGCSDRCRRVLAEMAAADRLDFSLVEADYFNPWHATRALVVWFGLELVRAEGKLELATAAYHRGFGAASDERGQAYLQNVIRLRRTYFDGWNTSPTWRTLRAWMRIRHADRGVSQTSPP